MTALLNDRVGTYACKFTSSENQKERENILELFKKGVIKTITAIRCLDEGVDIPQLERAFILSSGTNPKEYIQRRGRVLRLAPHKEYAYIYDFIVIPTMDKREIKELPPEVRAVELKVISREYERLKEFASLAEDGDKATLEFLKMWQLYFE